MIKRSRGDLALSLALFVLAILPYRSALDAPLNGIDAIPTVAAAQVSSLAELPSVLVRELRGGANASGYYWRPLTLVTYTADFSIWGWNAFGYHLTDLILAGLATVAVYALTRVAFARPVLFAAAVAALFALHPAPNEVVPAVARRQEPLMMIGLALALIGAARLPAPRAWALHLAGCAITVMSVERGLALPAIVGWYLLLCHPAGGSFATRLRRAIVWTLPTLGMAVAFFALRGILFGTGGIGFRLENFLRVPPKLVLWLVYPQQFIDLSIPTSLIGGLGLLGLVALLAVSAAIVVLRSRERPLLAFCALWIGSYMLILTVAGLCATPWYTYTVVVPLALAACALAADGLRQLRERGDALLAVLSFALAAAIALPSTAVSPLWTDYPGWRVVDGLTTRFLSELERVSQAEPADATLVLLNLPSAYRENDDDWLVTLSAAGLWPRSVRVFGKVAGIRQTLLPLGAATFVGDVTAPRVQRRDGSLRVFFDAGESEYQDPGAEAVGARRIVPPEGRGVAFVWPPPGAKEPVRLYVFNGKSLLLLAP